MKQKKIVCFLTMLSVLLISQSIIAQEQSSRKSSATTKADLVYQCENDLGVIANKPGNCNKCGSKLIAMTMDEAMDNLSGKKTAKPEMKVTKVYSVRTEKTETHNDVEVAESDEEILETEDEESGHNHSAEHEKKVNMTDLNRDGFVYQCLNCPGEMADELDDCEECFKMYIKVTVEDAKKNVPVCDH